MADKKESLLDKVNRLKKTYQSIEKPVFTSSGMVNFDAILGGGIPRGAIVLHSSDNGLGKSTIALDTSYSYCEKGLKVLWLDFEGSLNESLMDGVGISKFDINKNPNGTFIPFRVHTFVDCETMFNEFIGLVDLIVVDSATAILTEKMEEGSVEDYNIGAQARVMGNLLRKYKSKFVKTGTSMILINQVRANLDSLMAGGGDKEAGGKALKFFSDYRLIMKKAKDGDLVRTENTAAGEIKIPYGVICNIWAEKNRFARPFIKLPVSIIFGRGVSNDSAYLSYLERYDFVKKGGAGWYDINVPGVECTLDGEVKTRLQGEEKLHKLIAENSGKIRKFIESRGGISLLMTDPNKVDYVTDEEKMSTGYEEGDEKGYEKELGEEELIVIDE